MARPPARALAAAAGMLVFGVLGWVALSLGLADLLAYEGRAPLRAADRTQRVSDADWQAGQSQLERALELDPGNPALAEDLGRVHELRARAAPAAGAVRTAELGRSLEAFRRSLRRRPTSPYTWANIALVKSQLAFHDAGFLRAIEHAARLGPWEPEVQIALADIGFRDWGQLPPGTRATIHAALQRGLKRQADTLFDLARRYGRLDILCATPGVARSSQAMRCI